MRWEKLGRIHDGPASYPTVDRIGDTLRLYYGCRTATGQSRIKYIDIDSRDPLRAIGSGETLELGPPGSFDCDGHAPRCIVECSGKKLLYLIGWNRKVTTPYQLAIGLAEASDHGTWIKHEGPVMDRGVDEPYFATSPHVLFDGGQFRMWYCSCTGWKNGEPYYLIRYATSPDGVRWTRGPMCLHGDSFAKALAWPTVWKEGGYKMIYSYRSDGDYRTDPRRSYRLGYAESEDGISWIRKDAEVGIARSNSGWDSAMMAYTAVCGEYLFYNGNGFGATGIGVAKRVG